MSEPRKIYGWEDNGVVFLSTTREGERRPWRAMNRYDTREEAEAEVKRRNTLGRTNCVLVWEN